MQAQSVSIRRRRDAQEARDRVVLEHLPLVRAIAIRVHENLPVHVDLDDLIHAGVLGLFDAAEKFDSDKNVAFQSYAKHRIKGAILDSLRQLDWASRDLRKRQKQVESVTRDLTATTGTAPRRPSSRGHGRWQDRWHRMTMELRTVGLTSTAPTDAEAERDRADEFPAAPEVQPDHMCERASCATRWLAP